MEGEGWYDSDEGVPAENVPFADGEGYLLMNDFGDGATITYAGQVVLGATEINIPANVSICGNATPVAIDISSIVISGLLPNAKTPSLTRSS